MKPNEDVGDKDKSFVRCISMFKPKAAYYM